MKRHQANSQDHQVKFDGGKKFAKQRDLQKAWRERNPLAIWAHSATRSAIRRGLIKPEPCEVCGATAEAHHPNHADPLCVQWLCRTHHKRLNAALRKGGVA